MIFCSKDFEDKEKTQKIDKVGKKSEDEDNDVEIDLVTGLKVREIFKLKFKLTFAKQYLLTKKFLPNFIFVQSN